MSHTGKLIRGLKWYAWRNAIQGEEYGVFGDLFLPKDILNDDNKMKDVNYYLEFIKNKDEVKVNKILLKIRFLERGMSRSGMPFKNSRKLTRIEKAKLDDPKEMGEKEKPDKKDKKNDKEKGDK